MKGFFHGKSYLFLAPHHIGFLIRFRAGWLHGKAGRSQIANRKVMAMAVPEG